MYLSILFSDSQPGNTFKWLYTSVLIVAQEKGGLAQPPLVSSWLWLPFLAPLPRGKGEVVLLQYVKPTKISPIERQDYNTFR